LDSSCFFAVYLLAPLAGQSLSLFFLHSAAPFSSRASHRPLVAGGVHRRHHRRQSSSRAPESNFSGADIGPP
jgi:hypothetical protein